MNEYPAKLNTGYYRVRTDWNDDASGKEVEFYGK